MATLELDNRTLYYELRGQGTALLMFNHSGASSAGWSDAFLTDLQANHQLVLIDFRGTGRSTDSDAPYTIDELANDALAVLDHANIDAADVLGLSLGGTVAQAFVRSYPLRSLRLVLLATFAGPRTSEPPPAWAVELFQLQSGLARREAIRRTLPLYYSAHAIETMEDDLISLTDRGTCNTAATTAGRQANALRQFDSYEYLPSLRIPALVIHGDADVLISWRTGATLAKRIPDTKWTLLEDVGHVIPGERPHELARQINDFLV